MRGHDGQKDRRATVAFAFAAAALIVLGAPARGAGDSAPASRPPHSIAVLDFVDRTPRAGRGWLAKGLADMVITDLSASRRLLVVDRERMQHVVREMALGATGHVDRATAPRAGQIAKVRWVLFGSFAHTGGRVALEALLIDVEEQRTLRIEQVRGPVAKIFALEQALVAAVVRKLDAPMTEAELRLTKLLKTESLPAFEHHARSLGLFDDGRWFDAFVEERLARKADARYVAAHIRVARLYDELGALEHARVEYRALADGDSRNALPAAFYFRMGVLLGDTMGDRAPAAVALQRILVRQPKLALPFRITDPPERSYEWQYTQLGSWEAKITNISPTFLHLKALDRLAVWALDAGRPFEAAGFYSRIARIVSTRKSAIGATSLVRPFLEEAMKRYEALYWRFVLEDRDATLYPPAAVHLLSAKDATARPGAKPTHSGGHGINWLAPPGHVIAQVRFVLRPAAPAAKPQQGRRKPRSPYSVRLMCPGYHDLLLDHVEGAAGKWRTVTLPQGLRALRCEANGARDWEFQFVLRKWTRDTMARVPQEGRIEVSVFPDEALLVVDGKEDCETAAIPKHAPWALSFSYSVSGTDPLPPGRHTVAARWADGRRMEREVFVSPREETSVLLNADCERVGHRILARRGSYCSLTMDRSGRLWLLWDETAARAGDLGHDPRSNLYAATSPDGTRWSAPKRLSVSSLSHDAHPVLQQDGRGRRWLVWESDRDPDAPRSLWIASSPNGAEWTFPRKIALPETQKGDRKTWQRAHDAQFAFAIDHDDAFWLVWQGWLLRSGDGRQWRIDGALQTNAYKNKRLRDNTGAKHYHLGCDRAGRLLLLAIRGGGKEAPALWRRTAKGQWDCLGRTTALKSPETRSVHPGSFALRADGSPLFATVRSCGLFVHELGADEAKGKTHWCVSEWSKPFHPAIAVLRDGRFVVAYGSKDGLIVDTFRPTQPGAARAPAHAPRP